MAALSVESAIGGTKTGRPDRAPRASASARNRLLAETPPAIPTLRAPSHCAASNVRSSRALDHDALEAGADVGDVFLRQTAAGREVRASLLHEPQHGGLQAGKAEVGAPRELWRQQVGAGRAGREAIGVSQPRHGKVEPIARGPCARGDRSPVRPDSRGPATWPPCHTPHPPHRRACGRRADRRQARGRGRGSCGRPRRRARPPAAAARRGRA